MPKRKPVKLSESELAFLSQLTTSMEIYARDANQCIISGHAEKAIRELKALASWAKLSLDILMVTK